MTEEGMKEIISMYKEASQLAIESARGYKQLYEESKPVEIAGSRATPVVDKREVEILLSRFINPNELGTFVKD